MQGTVSTTGFILALGAALVAVTGAEFESVRRFAVTPSGRGQPGLTLLSPESTGFAFTNTLTGDASLTNTVAHNGSGLALGDVDADGWVDIYLCNLEGPNRLFRNLGNWRFEELPLGEVACEGQFSTGVVLTDVDGDGDLDLLVNGIAAGTRLFLNDGKARWTEKKDAGLSRTASPTSLALADIDGDGDLDLYCPHYIDAMTLSDPTTKFALARQGNQWEVSKINGESGRSARWRGRFEVLPDGRVRELPEVHGLYRNEGGGRFTAIEQVSGTYQDEAGNPIPAPRDWGLAAMFRDINGDGAPDLYVCNDNVSPDRIWINTGKGEFRALAAAKIRHTSRSSMGVDFADLNRDGRDDFIVVDMLARDPARRKTQLVRDRPDPLDGERPNERPQFNRNMLFFGQPGGRFSERALFAGVAATDWTWCPLFVDVDLDGYEDLLLTNGFEHDVMDQDSQNDLAAGRRKFSEFQLKRSAQFRPSWRTPNAAFHNRGDGTFEAADHWGFNQTGLAYGAALGDLDNDGDLDVVVNNLNAAAGLYRNDAPGGRVAVRLRGRAPNTQGVGARVILSGGAVVQSQEMIAGGRYMSGDEVVRVFAANIADSKPLQLDVRWRSGALTTITNVSPNHRYEITEPAGAASVPREAAPKRPALFEDVSVLLAHRHVDQPSDELVRQPLLPRRLSRLGPGVAWYDLDGDGWEDLTVAGGLGGNLALFHNEKGEGFGKHAGAIAPEDQGSVVGWSDGQGNRRLLVALSNLENPARTNSAVEVYSPANWKEPVRLPTGVASPGPMTLADVDGDGDLDVFVGGRFRPGRYPEAVSSAIWRNDGGVLVPDIARSEVFKSLGLVCGATFADLDGDGRPDLALAMEWGPVRIFLNRGASFQEQTEVWGLGQLTGFWTGITTGDFDGDGRPDLAVGNRGRNSLHELVQPARLAMFHGDWNGDGGVQLMEAWAAGTNWFPVQDRGWLDRGFPRLHELFPTHAAFGRATVRDIPGIAAVAPLKAARLDSVVLLNRGGKFEAVPLPMEAQLAPAFSLNVGDANGDGVEDLFVSQNFFGSLWDLSRDDDGQGLWLVGRGDGRFAALDAETSGVTLPGEQRGAALGDFNHDGRVDLAVTQNNSETKLYVNRGATRGLRGTLVGSTPNPDAIGAQMRVVYPGDRRGPLRSIQAGSGYWSQDAATQVLGLSQPPVALWVRWPDGREQTVPLKEGQWNLRIVFQQ